MKNLSNLCNLSFPLPHIQICYLIILISLGFEFIFYLLTQQIVVSISWVITFNIIQFSFGSKKMEIRYLASVHVFFHFSKILGRSYAFMLLRLITFAFFSSNINSKGNFLYFYSLILKMFTHYRECKVYDQVNIMYHIIKMWDWTHKDIRLCHLNSCF